MRTPSSSESLKFEIAQRICGSIFAGALTPGQALRELALAREMSVSQAVIREGLSHLEQMGLVTRIPNKGSSVAHPSFAEIRERLRLRVAVEQMAMINCSELMTEQDFEKAESLAMAIEHAVRSGSAADASKAGYEFHRFLWSRCSSSFLRRSLEQICTPLFAFHELVKQATTYAPRGASEHLQMLDALRGKNPEAIRAAVSEHVEQKVQEAPVAASELVAAMH